MSREEFQKPLEERISVANTPMMFNTHNLTNGSVIQIGQTERTLWEMLTDLAANKADGREGGN